MSPPSFMHPFGLFSRIPSVSRKSNFVLWGLLHRKSCHIFRRKFKWAHLDRPIQVSDLFTIRAFWKLLNINFRAVSFHLHSSRFVSTIQKISTNFIPAYSDGPMKIISPLNCSWHTLQIFIIFFCFEDSRSMFEECFGNGPFIFRINDAGAGPQLLAQVSIYWTLAHNRRLKIMHFLINSM